MGEASLDGSLERKVHFFHPHDTASPGLTRFARSQQSLQLDRSFFFPTNSSHCLQNCCSRGSQKASEQNLTLAWLTYLPSHTLHHSLSHTHTLPTANSFTSPVPYKYYIFPGWKALPLPPHLANYSSPFEALLISFSLRPLPSSVFLCILII